MKEVDSLVDLIKDIFKEGTMIKRRNSISVYPDLHPKKVDQKHNNEACDE